MNLPSFPMDEISRLILTVQTPGPEGFGLRQEAFGQLVTRFQDMVYGYAYALLGDGPLAQDAAQETFLSVYQHLNQLQEPKAFPGWIKRIAHTFCMRILRARAERNPSLDELERLPETLPYYLPGPLSAFEHNELKRRIQAALRDLPEKQRLAAVLYYIDGYSQPEIAGFLEESVDAVKKQLQRARSGLQERMLDMVQENLHEQRPSRDDRLVQTVLLFTTLKAAGDLGQLDAVEMMLVDGVDINAKDEEGQTLLHWAVRQGNLEVIEFLLKHGASQVQTNHQGQTALQTAVTGGNQAIIRLLQRQVEER